MSESSFLKSESAGYLANHMARLFAAQLHEALAQVDIAPAQFVILLELWEEDGLIQNELVKRLDLEQATVANTLARMERDGLIRRELNPVDTRAKYIYLTEMAREKKYSACKAARQVNQYALADLNETEQAQLLDLMRRVIGTQRTKISAS